MSQTFTTVILGWYRVGGGEGRHGSPVEACHKETKVRVRHARPRSGVGAGQACSQLRR
jgi:hypothetical protein